MSTTAGEASSSEIMLFGVRLVVDSMRKSVSLNNLSQYVHPQDHPPVAGSAGEKDVAAGYASADESVRHRSPSSSANAANRDRKRGVPWTEEEHKLFLTGLQKVGKGDWRGISRNFVKTRTPTQVASHAQKYFLRRSNLNRRRRRSSLFDITTETVSATLSDDQTANKNDPQSKSPPAKSSEAISSEISPVKFSIVQDYTMTDNTISNHHQMSIITASPDLNLSLSLTSESQLNAMPSFFTGDSMISVG